MSKTMWVTRAEIDSMLRDLFGDQHEHVYIDDTDLPDVLWDDEADDVPHPVTYGVLGWQSYEVEQTRETARLLERDLIDLLDVWRKRSTGSRVAVKVEAPTAVLGELHSWLAERGGVVLD